MKVIARTFRFFRPDLSRVGLATGLLLLSIGLNVLKPWPVAWIIDIVLNGNNSGASWLTHYLQRNGKESTLLLLAAMVLALHVVQSSLAAAQNYFAIQVGLSGLRRVRNELFGWLQKLSLRFHQGSRSGDLIYRASWDTYAFQTLFQQGLMTALSAGISLCLMAFVMAKLNLYLTIVSLAVVPFLVASIRMFGKRMAERTKTAQQADSLVAAFVQQGITALPLVQSYTQEERELSRFGDQTEAAQDSRLAQHRSELVYWFAISLIFAVATAAVLWMGSREVLGQRLSVGGLWIFLSYLNQLYEPLNQLSHVGATVSGAQASVERVFEILETPEEVKDKPDGKSAISRKAAPKNSAPTEGLLVDGALTFENIGFGYEAGHAVLSGVTFHLAAGESAALIGPSGVGKTTLMNLVPRFYDPVKGRILLDGVDLRDLRLRDLRRQIAVVLQEPILLPASIAENIAFARPGASAGEIESAAHAANADGFIRRLPRGYETIVGEGSVRLSVGEKQRLNLARAFLKDAPILLLDEPTSALDAESEELVVASLFDLMKSRTTIMIAHRLTTIRRVDKIVVLENGGLAQFGSHRELEKSGGYYQRVAAGQVVLD